MRHYHKLALGLFLTACMAQPIPASAQNQLEERPSPLRPPAEAPSRVGVRPLDDSDPKMRDHMLEIARLGPCGRGPAEQCERARSLFAKHGERLTAYLIRQYEASIREGYLGAPHYLVRIGKTRTDRAVRYLVGEVRDPAEPRMRRYALHGLVYVEDHRAIDEAMAWIRTDVERRVCETAITAAQKNVELLGLRDPRVEERLAGLERDASAPYAVRFRASKALDSMESRGLVSPRSRPSDLRP